MAGHNPSSRSEIDLGTLSFKTRALLVTSPLYKTFLHMAVEAQMERLASGGESDLPTIKNVVQALLTQRPEDALLLFAVAWCGAAAEEQKVSYLFERPDHFAHLRFWKVFDHRYCILETWAWCTQSTSLAFSASIRIQEHWPK